MQKIAVSVLSFLFILYGSSNLYLFFLRQYNLGKTPTEQPSLLKTEKKSEFICKNNNLYTCYLEEYKRISQTKKDSEKEIYELMRIKLGEGQLTSFECHTISHKIGEYSYLNNPNQADLFGIKIRDFIDDLNCATGFYHGILLGMQKKLNIEQSLQIFREIDIAVEAKIDNQKGDDLIFSYEILHGLGHAFFIDLNDIDKANKKCDLVINNPKYLDICYSGVFMENSFLYQNMGEDFDIKMCSNYEEKYRYACLTGTRNSHKYLKANKEKYVQSCYSYGETEKKGCLKNYIIQESSENKLSLNDIQTTCSLVSSEDFQTCLKTFIVYQNLPSAKKRYM
jgi:hypothetical protein